MRKIVIIGLAGALALLLGLNVAQAGRGNNGLSGPHWQFNIIGHPRNVDVLKNDDSNGRAIMVPLKNANGLNEIVCEDDEFILTDDLEPTWSDQEPAGAKIHFVAGEDFDIIDRDATDKDGARIMVPTVMQDGQPVLTVDIYVRVLGKPLTCMDIDGFAFDNTQQLWFWSGSVDLNRKHGKASWVDVRHLFDVWWCEVDLEDIDFDGITEECVEGTEDALSVFNNVFSDYFWSILNNGTRLVQVRLYPR